VINVRRARGESRAVEINTTPLVDVTMCILIFFVATSNFVKEAGIEVQRASAASATSKESATLMIGVTPEGDIFMEGKRIDIRSVRGMVERTLAENPEGGVVVVADRSSQTGAVVAVMDQCRLAGAKNLSLAAKKEGS
jgi:biopolymer transport protein ExbD